eukprot:5098846-Alexandrium_andersonii.AAC.1
MGSGTAPLSNMGKEGAMWLLSFKRPSVSTSLASFGSMGLNPSMSMRSAVWAEMYIHQAAIWKRCMPLPRR